MYIAIRRYEGLDAPTFQRIAGRSSVELVDAISRVPGFVAHYATLAEDGALLGISIFTDRAGAEESNRRALEWVGEHWKGIIPAPPRASLAEVVSHRAGVGLAAPRREPQSAAR